MPERYLMGKQKEQNQTIAKSRWRVFFAALSVCSAISLLGDFVAWIIQRMGGISFSLRSAATIGLIGGADGPTSIFVAAATSPGWQILIKILLLIASVLLWRHCSKRK